MHFLVLFALMFGFASVLPRTFKVFYALFMSLVFTLGPAGMLSIAFALMGIDIPFSLLCGGCFVFIAVPFIMATMPRKQDADEEDE